jgi:hypothetical protein
MSDRVDPCWSAEGVPSFLSPHFVISAAENADRGKSRIRRAFRREADVESRKDDDLFAPKPVIQPMIAAPPKRMLSQLVRSAVIGGKRSIVTGVGVESGGQRTSIAQRPPLSDPWPQHENVGYLTCANAI